MAQTIDTIKKLLASLLLVQSLYGSVEQDFELLRTKTINGVNSVRDMKEPWRFAGEKKTEAYTKLVMLYNASQTETTRPEIKKIRVDGKVLSDWLQKVSTMTDSTQMNKYFGGTGSENYPNSFNKVFTQFEALSDKVTKDLGIVTVREASLNHAGNKVAEINLVQNEIFKSLDDSNFTSNIVVDVRTYYKQTILKLLAQDSSNEKEYKIQYDYAMNLASFNSYAFNNFLINCTDTTLTKKYTDMIDTLIDRYISLRNAKITDEILKKQIFKTSDVSFKLKDLTKDEIELNNISLNLIINFLKNDKLKILLTKYHKSFVNDKILSLEVNERIEMFKGFMHILQLISNISDKFTDESRNPETIRNLALIYDDLLKTKKLEPAKVAGYVSTMFTSY